MVPHRFVRGNYGGKLPVSIKYQNVHSFKEGMIPFSQSILGSVHIYMAYHIYMAQFP